MFICRRGPLARDSETTDLKSQYEIYLIFKEFIMHFDSLAAHSGSKLMHIVNEGYNISQDIYDV